MSQPKNVVNFPKWKNNSTAAEKLAEVSQYANFKPEDCKDVVIILLREDNSITVETSGEQMNSTTLGYLEMAKWIVLGGHRHED